MVPIFIATAGPFLVGDWRTEGSEPAPSASRSRSRCAFLPLGSWRTGERLVVVETPGTEGQGATAIQ